jgi:hypothetical protein
VKSVPFHFEKISLVVPPSLGRERISLVHVLSERGVVGSACGTANGTETCVVVVFHAGTTCR